MRPISAAVLSISGMVLSDDEKRLLERSNPVGVVLFKRNVQDKKQVRQLVQSIKEVIGRTNVFVAVDQEGGSVCRFRPPIWNKYISQGALGSLKSKESVETTRLHGQLISCDLRELGINVNYAPVLDIAYKNTTDALEGRLFSSDPRKVVRLGKVLLDVYQKNGVCPCVKHLPGHGRAVVDPHFDLPFIEQDLKSLERDFYPFEALAEFAPLGMTANIVFSAIDTKPVTQSKKAIQEIIRDRIGFKGFLLSDAIDMHALKGNLSQKTKVSLKAGCDAICYCAGKMDELIEVVGALSPLTDAALARLERMNEIINRPIVNIDKKAASIRYMELAKMAQNLNVGHDAVEVLNNK